MRNIKLVIQYDGSNFLGWQSQPSGRTVKEEVEKTIKKITGEKVKLNGSGRTDRSVHSRGQTANFYTSSTIPGDRFTLALNSFLPDDISIKESSEVKDDFHARYSAISKEYKYLIYNQEIRDPILRNYTYHVSYKLDFNAMLMASKDYIGTYDFKAFMASGGEVKSTIRTIYETQLSMKGDIIEFKVRGNGFLYNMVRIMIGTLIDIGRYKLSRDSIKYALESQDRNQAGHTAPPQGLYLETVYY